ncbi:hypothetical protein KUTeg_018483 [Tegillarca granosa]|uniref:C-type lectin domain-containing protein n=1 Tax=Tegillarca granosa TaxID=220873 RepID=A0ABQ9EMX8_TEGGR|nr:hypothetical protein KUTeg_018483 [Tegillarca granosa]
MFTFNFVKHTIYQKTNSITDPSQGNIGYYIGGSDMSTEGNFIWMHSRQPFNYTDWKQGMPDSHGNHEDCVHLYPLFHFQWNDIQCSTPGYFICEKPSPSK